MSHTVIRIEDLYQMKMFWTKDTIRPPDQSHRSR